LFWEDIDMESEVTSISRVATTQTLVKWAGASGDFNPLHYEDTFAASHGIGKPIVHGQLKQSWLIEMMTRWIGDGGTLKKISCQFRGMDWPRSMKTMTEPQDGETWWCKGIVTNKFIENEKHYVECNVWVENGKGEQTTSGKALAVLPVRR